MSGTAYLRYMCTCIQHFIHTENALESRPFSRGNKYLIACNGDQISLTCTHGNVVSGSTRWIISPPVNCASNIIHDLPIDAPQCGPFTFHSVTEAVQGVTQLSSTAIATASTMMSGSVVECRGGNVIASSSVGNLTLCIVGQFTVYNIPFVQNN